MRLQSGVIWVVPVIGEAIGISGWRTVLCIRRLFPLQDILDWTQKRIIFLAKMWVAGVGDIAALTEEVRDCLKAIAALQPSP